MKQIARTGWRRPKREGSDSPRRRTPGKNRHLVTKPVRLSGRGKPGLTQALSRGPYLTLSSNSVVNVPERERRIRIRLDILLPIIIFALSLFQNLDQVHVSPFHRDEARWVGRSFFLRELADPFGSTWNDYYLTNTQAPFANYVMGVGLLAFGRDLNVNRIWDFNYSTAWNELAGAKPEPADLNADRRMNSIIGALVALTIYAIGARLGNRFGGFLGGAFIACHPLHILLSSQALADEFLALCIVLIFLVSMNFARAPNWPRAVLLGVLLGIGGSTKLSPLLLSLPLAGLGVGFIVRSYLLPKFSRDPMWERSMGIKLIAQPFIAAFVFVAAFPYLWVDPIVRSYHMFTARVDEMESQGSIWGNLAVNGPLDAMARLGKALTESTSTSGRLGHLSLQVVSLVRHPAGIDLLVAFAGAIMLGALLIRFGLSSQYGLLGVLMASQFCAIILGMKADFNRYHLPVVVIMAICISVVGSALWAFLGRTRAWRFANLLPGVRVLSVAEAPRSSTGVKTVPGLTGERGVRGRLANRPLRPNATRVPRNHRDVLASTHD
jgi:hypothetical protein